MSSNFDQIKSLHRNKAHVRFLHLTAPDNSVERLFITFSEGFHILWKVCEQLAEQ